MLSKAIAIASKAHLNQTDRGGNPYILHPLWVMNKIRHLGEKYMIVAVLHDTLEDCDEITVEFLKNQGFNGEILSALSFLNHDKSKKTYEEYITKLSKCRLAREVKLRDLEHNSKITRLKGLRGKDLERLKKYNKAYTYLKSK
jgi:(p)ppGpp synthase/HD superfamily hydrolase